MTEVETTPSVSRGAAIKTYRYLRVAMALLAVAIGLSVLIEWWATSNDDGILGRCALGSISAYFYSPVRSIFVGGLVAVGICLIVIKGSNRPLIGRFITEDDALNVAGMLAPVVALVPTGHPSATDTGSDYFRCMSVPFVPFDTAPGIKNNVLVLILIGVAGLAITWFMPPQDPHGRTHSREAVVGVATSTLVLVVGTAWYNLSTATFLTRAHGFAAVVMFVFLGCAVACNVRQSARGTDGHPFRRWYLAIVVLMAVAGVGFFSLYGTWPHAILWLEAVEIALFATFWIVQSVELKDETLR